MSNYTSENVIDAEGKFIYPGFNDGHSHFWVMDLLLLNMQTWLEQVRMTKLLSVQRLTLRNIRENGFLEEDGTKTIGRIFLFLQKKTR